jgi:NAD(P)-dependent dehydrogenase (short-subunit alcohol dehydrogenase family)
MVDANLLARQHALVTGGGAALAKRLAAPGANLTLFGRATSAVRLFGEHDG